MSSDTPPARRRFAPTPVETTTRSVKKPVRGITELANAHTLGQLGHEVGWSNAEDVPPPELKGRRFLPQPVEQSSRSSRKKQAQNLEHTPSNDLVNVEDSKPRSGGTPTTSERLGRPLPIRRFVPEPIETTTHSTRRRFAPEPIETSARSSKDKRLPHGGEDTTEKPRRKFLPEPIETTTISRRKRPEANGKGQDEEEDVGVSTPSSTSSAGRKFTPELLETAKGSYRKAHRVTPQPVSGDGRLETSEPESAFVVEVPESRFSTAALVQRQYEQRRRSSMQIPDLPTIEQQPSDEESDTPSLTQSQSSTTSEQVYKAKHDDSETFTDYVFRLAKESEQKKLVERAMAAYINERPHEPVDHFATSFDEDEDRPGHVGRLSGDQGVDPRTFRRSSKEEHDWEMENMRRHHAQLEKAKRELKEDTVGQSRFSAAALATRHHIAARTRISKITTEEEERASIRAAASPPMAGEDLILPFTTTPKHTRCETDQAPRPRTYHSDDDNHSIVAEPGLWTTAVNINPQTDVGLWNGLCQRYPGDPSRPPTPARSGLVTPAFERDDPFSSMTPGARTPGTRTPGRRKVRPLSNLYLKAPLTPPPSSDSNNPESFASSIDKKLLLEKQIAEEFPSRVITQIYNYLSLGYPSLAHAFDEELSKISRISVEDLRKDDENADAKGYVGAPEGDGSSEEEVSSGRCKRWEALRLYVREWARQSPGFLDRDGGGGREWGAEVRVRKGSWAQ